MKVFGLFLALTTISAVNPNHENNGRLTHEGTFLRFHSSCQFSVYDDLNTFLEGQAENYDDLGKLTRGRHRSEISRFVILCTKYSNFCTNIPNSHTTLLKV